ncbi:P-loop containing nucleoside triphosphate hydrolase protein [Xylaria intraflava]|nr:P-loop containing nucleoside triphosphate hydrolase protein [Xylaria intraflava]
MVQPFHIAGPAAGPLFGPHRPGINLVRDIFEKVLGLIDPSRANHALAIWTLSTSVIPNVIDLFYSLRHYVRLFFTSAVTIKANDELYLEVLNWLAHQQSKRRFINEYTAQTLPHPRPKSGLFRRQPLLSRSRALADEVSTIKYTPAFRTTWFIHGWNLFGVLRNDKHGANGSNTNDLSHSLPDLDYYGPVPAVHSLETVTITCLGWSAAPIQALLKKCREAARAQKRKSVTIRSGRDDHWAVSAVKPVRPLDTIHLEEDVKENLISDLERYLDPQRRRFYGEHGIPYRRGYLLHGPPGCGKSSLSLALAGYFGLDLYMVNLSSIYGSHLASLFAMLPARCFVLLEDIDAVGLARDEDDTIEEHNKFMRYSSRPPPPCSFSSLLNILDGVASQEGRVVIMTSNFPDKLDEALVRPGRIDVRVFMGHITQPGAEQMFMRMMRTGRMDKASGAFFSSRDQSRVEPSVPDDAKESEQGDGEGQTDEELQALARQFAQSVPEGTLTPAQLQGYLLQHLESAKRAVEEIAVWIVEEKRRAAEELERKEKKRKKTAELRKERALAHAAQIASMPAWPEIPDEETSSDSFGDSMENCCRG